MPMTPEARAAQAARMKDYWIKKKAETGELPADPAVREAMAKAPMSAVVVPPEAPSVVKAEPAYDPTKTEAHIAVDVDWERIPFLEGQQFYAHLKAEFERAGRILNARSMQRTSGYTCFMCKKHFDGNPGFTDFSYTDPKTGLSPRVDICGELCVINYNAMRINERHARDVARAQQERNG